MKKNDQDTELKNWDNIKKKKQKIYIYKVREQQITMSNEEFELDHVNTITDQEKSWEIRLISNKSTNDKKLIRRRFKIDE